MRRIIRWDVPVDDTAHEFPISGPIVHVAARSPQAVTFWTIESGHDPVHHIFQVVGTGHPYPDHWRHIGTALALDGALVWHLMLLNYDPAKQVFLP